MTNREPHAHFQIETTHRVNDSDAHLLSSGFKVGEEIQSESLVGFNPDSQEDRELLYACLGEYLNYLSRMKQKMLDEGLDSLEEHPSNHFKIFGLMHNG